MSKEIRGRTGCGKDGGRDLGIELDASPEVFEFDSAFAKRSIVR